MLRFIVGDQTLVENDYKSLLNAAIGKLLRVMCTLDGTRMSTWRAARKATKEVRSI